MRVIFMGTPDFAVGALRAIHEAGHDIVLVVTNPDKPSGRGGRVAMSPVKSLALELGLEVFQPKRIREENERLLSVQADVVVVAAFGQLLSDENLHCAKYGCLNIHASLLPKYRGASPIQQAILDGEKTTGVTIMQMDAGLDTGDILLQESCAIDECETGGSLFEKLSAIGAGLIVRALASLEGGRLSPTKQDNALSTMTGKIGKEMGLISWEREAVEIERQVRAMNPWPSAFTRLDDGRVMKIWEAKAVPDSFGRPGAVREGGRDCFYVACGSGALCVKEVQLSGKKRMSVHDFLLGFDLKQVEGFL